MLTLVGDTAFVFLSSRAQMVLPVTLELRYADGARETRELPIDMWNLGSRFTVRVRTGGRQVVGVVVDPRAIYPDIDRANNRWPR